MRALEFIKPLPPTHPYLAIVRVDPADVHRFLQMMDDVPELHVFEVERDHPDVWSVYVGCASEECRNRLEAAW